MEMSRRGSHEIEQATYVEGNLALSLYVVQEIVEDGKFQHILIPFPN